MQWFKHDTNAVNDAKIKKLLLRHGAVGYAVYFHCIELIASDISETNITFCLEHDSEIIADNLKIKGTAEKSGIQIVEEIMKYIVELKLFEERNNLIHCYKLLKRLDSSMTSNAKFRKVIMEAKDCHDEVMTESCKIRIDKIRIDENRLDNIPDESFDIFWNLYQKKVNPKLCRTMWKKIDPELHQEIFNHVREYVKTNPDKYFRKDPERYLKYEMWTSEIIQPDNKKGFMTADDTRSESDRFKTMVEKKKKEKADRDAESNV